jgi:hypothetical protein
MFCNGGTNLYTSAINIQSTGNVNIGTTSNQAGYILNVSSGLYSSSGRTTGAAVYGISTDIGSGDTLWPLCHYRQRLRGGCLW